MTRVLLVASNQERRPYPVAPLGLCLLAEALSDRFEVQVFDGMFNGPDVLRGVINDFEPHYIGMGVRNVEDPVMERPRDYVRQTREGFVTAIRESSSAPLILGGAGYSLFPQELLSVLDADYGVVGEAERTFLRLLEVLEAGEDVKSAELPGVVVAGETGPIRLNRTECVEPSRIGPSRLEHWIDFTAYLPRGTYPLQTKRGCAQRCIYCTYPYIEGSSFRLRPPSAIADELESVQSRLGEEVTFEFVDSILNAPPGHAEAICEELIRRGSKVRLRAMGLNPRGVSTELLELMQRAGFIQMDCTPDSAAPEVLAQLGKGFTVDALEEAALRIREVGIPCIWFLLYGGPGESEESFQKTTSFIDRFVDPQDMVYMWAGLRIYPNTQLHQIAIEQGIVGADENLLEPHFYVSPDLGRERCIELIEETCRDRPNCVPAWEAAPDKQMLRQALELRASLDITEPMFRTLIRLRRKRMGVTAQV